MSRPTGINFGATTAQLEQVGRGRNSSMISRARVHARARKAGRIQGPLDDVRNASPKQMAEHAISIDRLAV